VVAAHRGPPRAVSRPLLLGIDEGTTAVKAALFDLDLRPVAEASRRVVSRHPRPGWVEQDPLEIEAAVVGAVAELLAGGHGEVVACGLDHQGESVLAWDPETLAPVTPVVVWSDRRTVDGLDPYFSAAKVGWLVRHGGLPDGVVFGTVDAFLSARLGAGFATDLSTASRTQLADLGADAWSPVRCGAVGVAPAQLPALRDTAGDLGVLRHERWPAELPLRAQVVDQQAALAGAGGGVKATYGTGVFVLAHAGSDLAFQHPGSRCANARSDPGLLRTVAWRIAGRPVEYALDGGVFTAGALLEWLARDLGLAADPPALAALAATVTDAGGVRVLPALSGLGAPWWRPDARAVIAGLTPAARPAHVARAALEGIAWRVADVVAALPNRPDVLRVDGGLTQDPLLLRLQADALGLPVQRGARDATVLGAAALAAIGAGLLADPAAVAERLPGGERTEPARDAGWREAEHERWRAFVRLTSQL